MCLAHAAETRRSCTPERVPMGRKLSLGDSIAHSLLDAASGVQIQRNCVIKRAEVLS